MASMTVRLAALGSVAGLLSCTDPLQPDERLSLARGGPSNLAAPSALTSTPVSPTQVNLSWRDNASTETGFEVFRSTNGADGTFNSHLSAGADVTSLSDQSLEPLSQYCYKVRAASLVRRKVNYSGFSNVACATTERISLPAAANLDVEPYDFGHSIRITWTDNSSNETGFRVERSGAETGPWETLFVQWPNVTEAQNTVPVEQRFCYRVVALNAQGDAAPSNTDCTSIPAPPSQLSARTSEPQSIDLEWVDNSAVEDGYQVQRRKDGGLWSAIADLPPGAASYHDASVESDVTYAYRVRAKKEGGFSVPSNEVSIATATMPPSPPVNIQAIPSSSASAWVSWSDQSPNEEGFRVERSIDNQLTWQLVRVTEPNLTSAGGEPDLQAERLACFRVLAFNSQGSSAWTSDCTAPPAAPDGLSGTLIDLQTVDLAWNDNSAYEDGYEVWGWYGGLEDPSELVAELPANATTYRDWRMFPYYSYWVVARKDGGYSDFSNGVIPSITGQSASSDLLVQSKLPLTVRLRIDSRGFHSATVERRDK